MKNRYYLLFYCLVLASLILSACGSATATETTALPVETEAPVATRAPTEAPTLVPTETPETGPLTVLIDNDEGPITPANFNTFIGFWMVGWVYDCAVHPARLNWNSSHALATSATPSADGLTWTIAFVKASNGMMVNHSPSKDVIFSYNFLIEGGSCQ